MAPFGFSDDEWLAAQYLLFLDETGDEEEARTRTEALRRAPRGERAKLAEQLRIEQAAQRAIERMKAERTAAATPAEAAQGPAAAASSPPPPRAARQPGLWQRLVCWLRG